MPNDQSHKHPMVYEIKVSGRIDPERAAWFGNMSLNVKHTKEGGLGYYRFVWASARPGCPFRNPKPHSRPWHETDLCESD